MELIKVSKHVLINPYKVSCILQKNVKGNAIFSVMVDGNTYEIDDIEEFLGKLNSVSGKANQQFFAG